MGNWIIIVVAILGSLMLVGFISNIVNTLKEKAKIALVQEQLMFDEKELFIKYKEEVKESLDVILKEKANGFPWLANAIADYYENYDKIFAQYLTTKKRPAYIQAERIKEIANQKKLFKKEFLTCVVRQKNLGEAEAAPFFSLEFTKTLNYEPKYKLFRTAHFFPSHQFVQTQSSFCHYSADKG